jgi:hypothetical protein
LGQMTRKTRTTGSTRNTRNTRSIWSTRNIKSIKSIRKRRATAAIETLTANLITDNPKATAEATMTNLNITSSEPNSVLPPMASLNLEMSIPHRDNRAMEAKSTNMAAVLPVATFLGVERSISTVAVRLKEASPEGEQSTVVTEAMMVATIVAMAGENVAETVAENVSENRDSMAEVTPIDRTIDTMGAIATERDATRINTRNIIRRRRSTMIVIAMMIDAVIATTALIVTRSGNAPRGPLKKNCLLNPGIEGITSK